MAYKIKFTFTKKDMMKYISHLDLMRTLMRALRRAGLPIKFSEGLNPHPKLSLNRALKLGLESDNEEASIALTDFVEPEDFKTLLAKQLTKGIEIKDVKRDFN